MLVRAVRLSLLFGACPCVPYRQRKRDIHSARWPLRIASSAGCNDDILSAIDHISNGCGMAREGQRCLQSSLPVWLSKACILRSKIVAPMKIRPPAVTMGPP